LLSDEPVAEGSEDESGCHGGNRKVFK
jgi:hypothetical protein